MEALLETIESAVTVIVAAVIYLGLIFLKAVSKEALKKPPRKRR